MSMLGQLWLMLGALALVGCSDDSESKPPQAQLDCNLFAETWCGRAITCVVEVGTLQQSQYQATYNSCVSAAEGAVPCAKAVGTTASFDQCLVDIDAMPCSTWNVAVSDLGTIRPPTTCNGAVLISP